MKLTGGEFEFWAKGFKDAFEAIAKRGLYRCPQCEGLMPNPAKDYHICPCCGVEFGNDAPEYTDTEVVWKP